MLPSLPGYGFSATPQDTAWSPIRMASAWGTAALELLEEVADLDLVLVPVGGVG